MSFSNTFHHLLNSPANRNHKSTALFRFLGWQIFSRVWRHPVPVILVNGVRVLASRQYQYTSGVVYSGLPEFADMGFMLHLLREGDLFVDIGANIGCYTIAASGAAVAGR